MSTAEEPAGWTFADGVFPDDGPPPEEPPAPEVNETGGRRARLTWASEIEPEPVVWAWEIDGQGRIPAGSLSIAAGREGTGKSSFGIWQAAQITRGTLPGSFYGTPRKVLYVAVEDSWKHTLVPRLMASGADRSMVARFDVVAGEDDEEVMMSLPYDNALLEKAITDHRVAFVVIDPLMSVIGSTIDTHRERDVRTALDPLARIADRSGAVLLGIAHFNKGTGTDAASLITGSGAFKNVPRSVFGFAKDDTGEGDVQRVMTQVKNSLGRDDLPSLAYAITNAPVITKKGTAYTGRFDFLGESDRSVGDFLRDSRTTGDELDERGEVEAWLLDLLDGGHGRVSAQDVFKSARAAGFSVDQAKRAKKRLGIESEKDGTRGGWSWVAPVEGSAKGAKGAGDGSPLPSPPWAPPSAERTPPAGTWRVSGDPIDREAT